MYNMATKPQWSYDGSVNRSLDEQALNMNHIYIHPCQV